MNTTLSGLRAVLLTMVFLGAGMWHPDGPSLAAVRRAIDEDPKGWKRVRDAKRFSAMWRLSGDSLKRPRPTTR